MCKRNWNNIFFHSFEHFLINNPLVFFFRHCAVRRQLNFKQNIYLPQYDKFFKHKWSCFFFIFCFLSLMFTLINIVSKSTDLTLHTLKITDFWMVPLKQNPFLISVKGCCHKNDILLINLILWRIYKNKWNVKKLNNFSEAL